MKKIVLLIIILVNGLLVSAQLDTTYSKFLIHQSQNILHFPVWGETDNELYLNESFQWLRYDLNKCKLKPGYYLEHEMGINVAKNYKEVDDSSTKALLRSDTLWKPREVVDKKGNKIVLEVKLMESTMHINDLKVTGISGNAHSLAVSPSGRYVACIFELAGLMVFDIQQELDRIESINKALDQIDMLAKADYFLSNGDIESFSKTLDEMPEKQREDIEYNYFVGVLNYLTHESDGVKISAAIENLSLVTEDARFYNSNAMLAELHRRNENWPKAREYAEVAMERTPKFYLGYSVMGDYYTRLRETKVACKYYKKATKLGDPWGEVKMRNCK
ncbi:MAG: hypothetical protein JJ975_17630 [Bacteroidia bacterium]|nr:hypothetical protein [Bacteroidia bacterium]